MYGNGPPSCIVTYTGSHHKMNKETEEKRKKEMTKKKWYARGACCMEGGGGEETTNCVGRFESTDHCFETEANGRAQ